MHAEAAALVAARCETCLANLKRALGGPAMAYTRVVTPDRLLADGEVILDHGRRLRVFAPRRTSAPGALALFDESSGTLIAGSIVPLRSVPDLRDADVPAWRSTLGILAATRCRRLVPAYGSVGTCANIAELTGYLDDLDALVAQRLAQGVGLGELEARCDMPRYAGWARYDSLHRANASRTYLRLERAAFVSP
jgi:hypothetical protein